MKSKLLLMALMVIMPLQAQRRKVILDQDAMGPGGSNMLAMIMAIEAKDIDVLGITVESGDGWQDEDVAHTLRMLELIGRTDIPVFRGSTYPLLNTMERTKRWEGMYGKIAYKGAWMEEWPEYNTAERPRFHAANVVPPMQDGEPHTKAAEGSAADFLIREVHKYPGEVSILALGPLTNLALAARLDDSFASLAKDLYLMGGSLNPQAPKRDEYSLQFIYAPRSNFNFRWDPEAAAITLDAGWKRIVVLPTDATVDTKFDDAMMRASSTKAAKYIAAYPAMGMPMWDEVTVAIWLDPSIAEHVEKLSMDVNTENGSAGYGDTLTWRAGKGPGLGEPVVEAVRDINVPGFNTMFVGLMTKSVH
jgi:purine nucleosidase